MERSEILARLADAAGIAPRYWDIHGTRHDTPPETMLVLLKALGLSVETEFDAAAQLAALTDSPWLAALPPCVVLRRAVPVHWGASRIAWTVELESGESFSGEAADLPVIARHDSLHIDRRALTLPALPFGYHSLRFESGEETRLIVAPQRCYLPPALEMRRGWGVTAQLYALKGEEDWGIGDFGLLGRVAERLGQMGADAVGLNPLHALFLDTPDNASPYSPASRLFRNPLYLDVPAIPDFAESEEARSFASAHAGAIAATRAAATVDYPAVARIKLGCLELLYRNFRARHQGDARAAAFRAYVAREGEALTRFALYQTLCDVFGTHDWTAWPVETHHPAAIAPLAAHYAERIGFFRYLQWQCEEQLAATATRTAAGGMAVGLYNDLAVSIDAASADHWSRPDLFASSLRVGAPPDPFNETGQEWGVVPLNPLRLAADGYRYFGALLAANMRHAGALRIDHAMGLERLFLIPLGEKPKAGAYVRYPIEDLLAVAALESQRHRCLLIGEDLGTVPDGFRERMAEARVLSCRIFYFERDGLRFKRPEEYPELAAVSASTHDLATLRGFWEGDDIAAKAVLGFAPGEEEAMRRTRADEKRALLDALSGEGLLPGGANEHSPWSEALLRAVALYLAKSPGILSTVQFDDLAHVANQTNLPGSTHEYANWRRREAPPALELLDRPETAATLSAIATLRPR